MVEKALYKADYLRTCFWTGKLLSSVEGEGEGGRMANGTTLIDGVLFPLFVSFWIGILTNNATMSYGREDTQRVGGNDIMHRGGPATIPCDGERVCCTIYTLDWEG